MSALLPPGAARVPSAYCAPGTALASGAQSLSSGRPRSREAFLWGLCFLEFTLHSVLIIYITQSQNVADDTIDFYHLIVPDVWDPGAAQLGSSSGSLTGRH